MVILIKAKIKVDNNKKYDNWYLMEYEMHIGYAKSEKKAVEFEEDDKQKVESMCKKYGVTVLEYIK